MTTGELTRNERLVLTTVRDGVYNTVSQVAQATGLSYTATVINLRKLAISGYLAGYEVTLAGHKMLEGEPLKDSDLPDHHNIRPTL